MGNCLKPRLLNVWHTLLQAIGLKHRAGFTQIVARQARPYMVFNLKLKSTMKPIKTRLTQNVLSRSALGYEPLIAVIIVGQSVRIPQIKQELEVGRTGERGEGLTPSTSPSESAKGQSVDAKLQQRHAP